MNKKIVGGDSVAASIFRIHAGRIGIMRTAVGGGLMYTTVPLFIFLHLTVTLFLYKCLLRPLLGLKNLAAKDYIILDRYNLDGLQWFDRLNCLFCEYANGVILLMGHEIDQVATSRMKSGWLLNVLLVLYLIPQTLFLIVGMLLTTLPTNILMKLLGLHRGSHKLIIKQLRAANYAGQHISVYCRLIRLYKVSAQVITFNLEQIESSWCPIKHLEREGQALPVHHKHFFPRADLDLMQQEIERRGTVSDIPPKF